MELDKLVTNGGPLGTLVLVVWLFLKYLNQRDAYWLALYKEVQEQQAQDRAASRAAISDSAKSIQQLAMAVDRSTNHHSTEGGN